MRKSIFRTWLLFALAILVILFGASCGGGGNSKPVVPPPDPPATIVTPPSPQSVQVGNSATFTVVADGTPPLTHVWTLNGSVVGSDSPTYQTGPTTMADNGATIKVTVSNSAGSASATTTLTVTQAQNGLPQFIQAAGVTNATASGPQKFTCTLPNPSVAGHSINILAWIQYNAVYDPKANVPVIIIAQDDVGDTFQITTQGSSYPVDGNPGTGEPVNLATTAVTTGGAKTITFWMAAFSDATQTPIGVGTGSGACLEYANQGANVVPAGTESPSGIILNITQANTLVLSAAESNNTIPTGSPIIQAGPLPWVARYSNGSFVVEEFVSPPVGPLQIQFYAPTIPVPPNSSQYQGFTLLISQ